MKRFRVHNVFCGSAAKWVVLAMILTCFTGLCLARRGPRIIPLRVIQLPPPVLKGPISLEEAFATYRSVRELSGQPLDFVQIGQLVWAGQGATESRRDLNAMLPAEQAYPARLYFATLGGVFFYNPEEHSLVQTFNQDVRHILAGATAEQETVAQAACDIIVAAPKTKLPARVRNQAKRHLLLTAGHIAQNIQLQALALGLASVPVSAFESRDVSKSCRLPTDLEPIYMICVGYPAKGTNTVRGPIERVMLDRMRPKRAVLIIPQVSFRDEALFETLRELDQAMIAAVTASTRRGPIRGMRGGIAEAGIVLNDIVVDDYDAVIFIGGLGAREYFDNMVALAIVREAADKRKVLAAIGTAPTILARAGVLQGVRATSSASETAMLQQAGAIFTGAAVERDGPIVTGSEPQMAALFGRAVADTIAGR